MIWFRAGCIAMFLAVLLGAFGTHILGRVTTPLGKAVWQAGVMYHLIHGLALLAVGWLATLKPQDTMVPRAGWAFTIGLVLFSGSLYLLVLTGFKKLGMVTPLGGLAFLAGWVLLA